MCLSPAKKSSGFTLLEIVAVLLVLGIVSAVVVARSGVFIEESENSVLETKLSSHLRYAQIKAMSTNEVWGVKFQGNAYSLYRYVVPSPPGTPYTETYSFPGEESSSVAKPLSVGYSGYVSFDAWGRPCNDVNGSSALSTPLTIGAAAITPETGYIP